MEELAKLEVERGTLGYVSADGTAKAVWKLWTGKKGNRGALPAMRCAHS